MAQLTIHINGKPYIVGCDDGDEPRLRALAETIDAKVRAADPGGGVGETRVMLMGALLLADEAATLNARLAEAERDIKRLRADLDRADSRAVAALESAAAKIEAMASR